MSFLIPANTHSGESPDAITRRRQLAEAMLERSQGVRDIRHPMEGVAQLVEALAGRVGVNRANTAEAKARADASSQFQSAMGAALGSTPAQSASLSGNKQEFVNALMPAAIEQSQRTGVDPRIIVAQAAQETGWGKKAPGNNFFGIKSHGKGGGQTFTTHEVINGKRVKMKDSFRQYESPADSVKGYGDFILNNPRYRPFMAAEGLDNQLAALQASGYATDPNYSRSVGAIARSLPNANGEPVITPAGGPPPQSAPVAAQPEQAPITPPAAVQQPQQVRQPGLKAFDEQYEGIGSVPHSMRNIASPEQVAPQQAPQQNVVEALMGQPTVQPTGHAATGGQAELAQLMSVLSNPHLGKEQKQIAQMLLEQRLTPTDPMQQRMKELQLQKLEQQVNAPTKQPSSVQEYEFAKSQGYKGSFTDFKREMKKAGAVSVNIGQSEVGTIPQGFELFTDPKSGSRSMRPIVGGPAAMKAEKVKTAAKNKQKMAERGGGVVVEDIDRAIKVIDGGGVFNGTGLTGSLLAGLPGTDAHKLGNLIETVKANAGFDKLQQMRDASPTGGALGQVSERELSFLQAAIGNLSQSQDAETLKFNLNRVRKIYLDIIHGDAGPAPAEGGSDIDSLLKKYGG